jgi:hypothetical protein
MVQVVVLSANGDVRAAKITATLSPATVAKVVRKTKIPSIICTYDWISGSSSTTILTIWGWKEGKAGTENKHDLPPTEQTEDIMFGDMIVVANNGATDFTTDDWAAFYEEAMGGADESDDDVDGDGDVDVDEEIDVEEEEAEEEGEEAEEAEEEGEEAEEEEEEEAEEAEEEAEEEEEVDADDDCYDDGDEAGGGGKRRAPRRRTATSSEYRRMDMGLRSRVRLPAPLGKRAPRWQTAPELVQEPYTLVSATSIK